jgi:hypothetical protein
VKQCIEIALMEPWDYCQYWVKHIQPHQRGYRAECVRELEKSTFGQYKFKTINQRWGAKFEKRPESVLKLLEASHTLRSLEITVSQMSAQLAVLSEQLNKTLSK